MNPLYGNRLQLWAAFRRIGARDRTTLTKLRAARWHRPVGEIIDLRDEVTVHAPVLVPVGDRVLV